MVATAQVAGADTQTTTNAPLTCQTRLGAQAATFNTTWVDTPDPATAGEAVSYRATTPFKQTLPSGISGRYKGGQVFYRIPTNFNVTSVSTQPPAGGSLLQASASKTGDSIVITTTGDVPIDGRTYATPDLIINGTTSPTAGGTSVRWLLPYRVVANVDINGLGPVDADCTPNNPNTVIATTAVQVPGNRAPVVENQTLPVTKDTPKVVTLRATDADNDPITFTADPPRHGSVSISGNRATYTPPPGYLGGDSFAFTASDGRGGSATGRIDLSVISTAEGDTYPPTIALTAPVHGAVYTPGQVVKAAFSCADGESGLQSCVGTVATGSNISTTAGRHDFVVTAKDNGGNTTRRSISYRVISPTPVTQNYTAISGQPNVIPITCNQLVVPFNQRIPATVAAPAVVPENQTFVFRFAAGAMSVPPSTVASNVKYVIAPPMRGTVTDAQVVANTGTPNTASSFASIVNGRATLALPAIDGGLTGASFTPPAMQVTIRATAVPPAEVTTAFERYQVRLTTGQAGVNILTTDYDCPGGAAGTPNPVLTRTATIDVTPPTVALRAPVHGGRFQVGQSVIADFSCSDAHTVSLCSGTVADGQAINTSSPGARTFTVSARDAAGNVSAALASYKTFTAVNVNVAFTTTERSQLDAAAQAFNTTPQNLIFTVIYLLGLRLDADPIQNPLAGPPPATRPSILTMHYLPNDAALITYQASQYGLTSPNYHWFAAMLGVVIHQIYGGA